MTSRLLPLLALTSSLAAAPSGLSPEIPYWAADAVWYQIFPERFANGDPSNDPTRDSLEFPVRPPASWRISPWTADWYAMDDWEKEMGGGFYTSVFDRRYGGDLQGVIDRLDYLRDLGINVIYFNPVFWARSMHKYDGNSFHHVDPHFGPDPQGDFRLIATETADPATWHWTAADRLFLKLIAEARARGIRIVIDGVFNHTGRDFFAFRDLMENQEKSPYVDWYIVRSFDNPDTARNEFDYESWWGFKTLPIFRDLPDGSDLHPGPKKYVFDSTRRWMDPNGDGDPSDGIDGWRLDVAEEVPVGFWADWNRLVRQLNPEAITVSEVWGDASHFLAEAGFTATMNYHGLAKPAKAFLIDRAVNATTFGNLLRASVSPYPWGQALAHQNLMDSHDTDRVASMIVNRLRGGQSYKDANNFDYDHHQTVSPRFNPGYRIEAPDATDRAIQRLVHLFQGTYVGAPMIYYGTEAGMWGADDPDDRMPMVWPEMTFAPLRTHPLKGTLDRPVPVAFDAGMHGFFKALFALRHQHESLRRGAFRELAADNTRHTYAFLRGEGPGQLAVVMNRGEQTAEVRLPIETFGPEGNRRLQILFSTGTGATITSGGGVPVIRLPALTGVVVGAP